MAALRANKMQQISVLFLDVDGVLNTAQNEDLCSKMIKRLAFIIRKTNCYICLSTSWRTDMNAKQNLFKQLKQKGNIDIDSIYIGDTPTIYHKPRAFEIEAFLELKHKYLNNTKYKIIKWCAIDDMPLDKPLFESRKSVLTQCESIMKNHFVQTDDKVGLTDFDAQKVISFLS